MLEALKEFVVTLRGDVDEKSMDGITGALEGVSGAVVGFAQTAAGVLAAGALTMAIRATADRFNDLGDVAERMGNTTVEELDRLGYVAEMSGSDAATAAASFESLSKTIGEAASGVGRGAKLFEDYDLAAKNADGSVKTVGQVMDELRGKLDGLSAAEQQAMIQRMGLDRTMVGMLTSDTSEIEEEYIKRTKALGVNADEMAERAGAFNDAIGMLTRASSDVFTSFVQRILPALTRAIDTVARFINDNASLIAKYVKPIATAFDIASTVVTNFFKTVAGVVSALGPVGPAVLTVAAAIKVFNLALKMSPLARIVTAITAVISVLGLLYDDFQTAREGGKSFFSFWGPLIDVVNSASATFDAFCKMLETSGAWDAFTKAAIATKDTILGVISTVYDFFKGIVATVVGLFTGDVDLMKTAWDDFGESWKKTVEAFTGIFTNVFDGIDKACGNFFSDMLKTVQKWIDDAITAFTDFAKSIPDKVSDAAKGAMEKVKKGIKNLLSFGSDDDDKSKSPPAASIGVLSSPPPTGTTTSPALVTDTKNVEYKNITQNMNRTINVNSAREAAIVDSQPFTRLSGGVAG